MYKHKESGEIVLYEGDKTPVKRFNPREYEKLCEVASVKVKIYRFRARLYNCRRNICTVGIFFFGETELNKSMVIRNLKISTVIRKFGEKLFIYIYIYIFFYFSFKASNIVDIHKEKCPNYQPEQHVDVSLDAMSESKSTNINLDVYSSRFRKCRNIYVHQIVRPLNNYKTDNKKYLKSFLNQVCQCNCVIKCFIGDSPKRSFGRDALGHNSYFPCEYCTQKGHLFHTADSNIVGLKANLLQQKTLIHNQIEQLISHDDNSDENREELKTLRDIQKRIDLALKDINVKKKKIVWPSNTINGLPRTREEILEITRRLEEEPDRVSKDDAKGIVGRSAFLDIPGFDMLYGFPPEYLHGACLGVGKKLICLTFNVGAKFTRTTKRKLSSVQDFARAISKVKFFREFSRRARTLDLANMKGQEYRNIILFYFQIVIDCIENSAKERRLWLLFSFMIRACVIPTEEFNEIDPAVIQYCCTQFYILYEKLFGVTNCTYYTHIIGGHLIQIRENGPLTFTSAFPFESFYGEIRHAFQPGTQSPLIQIFRKHFVETQYCATLLSGHYSFSEQRYPIGIK